MNLVKSITPLPPTSRQVTQAAYCHLESGVGRSRRIRVACIGREQCRPEYRIELEGYVCHGLELVVQGKGELDIGGKTFRLLPGHLFLYGPGIAHAIRCDPRSPMVKYFADFSGNLSLEFAPLGVIQPGEVRRTPELDVLRHLFDEMIREGKKVAPARSEICAQQMKLLLLKTTEAGSADTHPYSQSLANLSRCRRLIEEQATELVSLQAVAEAVHLDPRYICRLFKRFNLPSPYVYLVNCRMNRAAELLVTTTDPIKAIAAQCGYPDPLHFSRVFKDFYSFPPREFRDQTLRFHPRNPS
ncbi:MAG: AraC family transcriptional regulator [Chthoniobacteraceae bacterium]